MMLNRKIFQALVFGFVLAITGCGDDAPANGNGGTGGDGAGGTGGDGAGGTGGGTGGDVMAGLYAGIDGTPDFDGFEGDGWAVCFYVANNMIELADSNACNLRNLFANESDAFEHAFELEVDDRGTPNNCDFDIDYEVEDFGPVPINDDGTFSVTNLDVVLGTWSFNGTIDGTTAFGTASQTEDVGNTTCSINWTATFRNP